MFKYQVSTRDGVHPNGTAVRLIHNFKFDMGSLPTLEFDISIETAVLAEVNENDAKYSVLLYTPDINIVMTTFIGPKRVDMMSALDHILLSVEMGNIIPDAIPVEELIPVLNHIRAMMTGNSLLIAGVEVPIVFNGGESKLDYKGLTVTAYRILDLGYPDIATVILYEGLGHDFQDGTVDVKGSLRLRHFSRPSPIGNEEVIALLDKHLN